MGQTSAAIAARLLAGLLGAAVLGGCAQEQLRQSRLSLPNQYQAVRGPLILRSDFPLAEHPQLIEELLQRRGDLCRHLDLPPADEPVEIYLFGDARAFDSFVHLNYAGLPHRRAYFVETGTRLTVYAGGRAWAKTCGTK